MLSDVPLDWPTTRSILPSLLKSPLASAAVMFGTEVKIGGCTVPSPLPNATLTPGLLKAVRTMASDRLSPFTSATRPFSARLPITKLRAARSVPSPLLSSTIATFSTKSVVTTSIT